MRTDVTIARCGRADRDDVAALLAAQLAEHEIPLEDVRLRAAVEGMLDEPARGRILLARGGGDAIGVAYVSFIWALEHGGLSAWLEELYVRPAERGQGLGRRLLLAAVEECATAGCAAVDLEVEASHGRAEHLYEREGFRRHRRARWVRFLRDAPRDG